MERVWLRQCKRGQDAACHRHIPEGNEFSHCMPLTDIHHIPLSLSLFIYIYIYVPLSSYNFVWPCLHIHLLMQPDNMPSSSSGVACGPYIEAHRSAMQVSMCLAYTWLDCGVACGL